jgi:DNA-binding NarL/FixJ family response regulator
VRPVRVLIADDHELVRRGMRNLLESSRFEICGEASNGREAVTATLSLKPDIVVLDISMPELNGLEATRQILRARPETQILILSAHETDQLVREVLSSGARGYLLKADAGRDLLAGLEELTNHRLFFTSKVAELVLHGYLHRPDVSGPGTETRPLLSQREREIVQLVAEGQSSKEIATALKITVKTVEAHRVNIMRKIEGHSVSDLVRYAIRNGIIEP